MNQTRKFREVRFVGITLDGKVVKCFVPYETRPRSAEQIYLLDKFRRADLIGGTLVEYLPGSRFSIEARRREVAKIILAGEGIAIKTTDGQAPLVCWMLDTVTFSERRGVFYLDVPCIGCYSIAPKGTEIPKTETVEEAVEDSARLLQEGMGRKRGEAGKAAGWPTAEERLRKTDFVGGTAVAYEDGCGFGIEDGRGTVTSFRITGDRVKVVCDEKCENGLLLHIPDLSGVKVEEKDGIYMITVDTICFALARRGVGIPVKPTMEEAEEDAKLVLAGKKE